MSRRNAQQTLSSTAPAELQSAKTRTTRSMSRDINDGEVSSRRNIRAASAGEGDVVDAQQPAQAKRRAGARPSRSNNSTSS